jgi:hypothetical protein
MAGSLKIAYRRKRNVGGRVLRNFARGSTDTLADTFREKMLHASEQSDVRCIYVLVDSTGRDFGSGPSVTKIANIKFST